jgi:nitrogen regulatory protein PII
MAKYHLMKRIEVIAEIPMVRAITEKLDRARVPGYSVLPIIEGRGMDNSWNSQGQVSDTTNMIVILCIVDESQADNVVDVILSAVRDRIGFLTISDVYVVRPERFRV